MSALIHLLRVLLLGEGAVNGEGCGGNRLHHPEHELARAVGLLGQQEVEEGELVAGGFIRKYCAGQVVTL